MAKKKTESVETPEETKVNNDAAKELVAALVQAIQLTKPVEKKTAVTRKPGDPWQPASGKKLKLKRKMYEHGITIDPDLCDNATIEALNRLKAGSFLNGQLKVIKRKDGGIDIDFPHKTASQRLRFLSQFRIASLEDICNLAIAEAAKQAERKAAGLPAEDDGSDD